MIWLGVSSPPRVRAVPVKRDGGASGSSPPGLGVFLNRNQSEQIKLTNDLINLLLRFLDYFFFNISWVSKGKPRLLSSSK